MRQSYIKDEPPALEAIAAERNPDLLKLYRDMSEMDAMEAEYHFKDIVAGRKLPSGFSRMPPSVQLKTLRGLYP